MICDIETFGNAGYSDRRLHLLELETPEALADHVLGFDRHCAVLVAWDALDTTRDTVVTLSQSLLDQGAVSICSWGRECQFVHEVLTETIVGPNPEIPRYPVSIMTTQHKRESFEEALWYFLWCSIPDDEFEASCSDALVLSIAQPAHAETARVALRAPDAFSEKILRENEFR
jgi:hypothetical protein